MANKKIFAGVIILLVVIIGWLFFKDTTPPITEVSTNEETSIVATATLNPEQPRAGEPVTVTFSFKHPDGSPVSDLMVHHARRVHTLLIGENLASVGHIHPEDFTEITDEIVRSGMYSVYYTFPNAGLYIIGVDFMNPDGELGKQFVVNVKGRPGMKNVEKDLRTEKCFRGYIESAEDRHTDPVLIGDAEVECPNGYKITMTPSVETVTAGEAVQLNYHIEKDGVPVKDLRPYLGAAIHFAIVPESLNTLVHAHGFADDRIEKMDGMKEMYGADTEVEESHVMHEEAVDHHEAAGAHIHMSHVPEVFGPKVVSESIVFPESGLYQVFSQLKRGNEIVFANFMIEVGERFDLSEASVFDLSVAKRSLQPNIVTLTEGDKAIMRVTTDETGEFHITGYEIEKDVTPGETTEVRFSATLPGRYNLELHPEGTDDDVEIGVLIVNPR